MSRPFIRNHQFNVIKNQTSHLMKTIATVADPKVVESVRYGALARILAAFPEATEPEKRSLERFYELKLPEQFASYLSSLSPSLAPFPAVSEAALRRLFPKAKKLKLPALEAIDFRFVTYLGWTDVAAGKLYLVYELDGRLVGIEGRCAPSLKKGTCFVCNRLEEVALVTAHVRTKPAHASPDYYKAVGNYMCADSGVCNGNVTDVGALESFVRSVLGSRNG